MWRKQNLHFYIMVISIWNAKCIQQHSMTLYKNCCHDVQRYGTKGFIVHVKHRLQLQPPLGYKLCYYWELHIYQLCVCVFAYIQVIYVPYLWICLLPVLKCIGDPKVNAHGTSMVMHRHAKEQWKPEFPCTLSHLKWRR